MSRIEQRIILGICYLCAVSTAILAVASLWAITNPMAHAELPFFVCHSYTVKSD